MLSDQEIMEMVYKTQVTLKNHKAKKDEVKRIKDFLLVQKIQNPSEIEKIEKALFEADQMDLMIDHSLQSLKDKLSELGFGMVFELATTMNEFYPV